MTFAKILQCDMDAAADLYLDQMGSAGGFAEKIRNGKNHPECRGWEQAFADHRTRAICAPQLAAAIQRLERATWDNRSPPMRADVGLLLDHLDKSKMNSSVENIERDDVAYLLICASFQDDGGIWYKLGHGGVTAIKIVKRHGPMDFIPYVEVWKGDHLHSEVAQHQCVEVEFLPVQEMAS